MRAHKSRKLLCLVIGVVVINAGPVWAQTGNGSIIGWGAEGDAVAWSDNYVAIAGGEEHFLALKADGSIVAWGWCDYGQCDVPAPNAYFVAVAAGEMHGLALKADGSISAWGWNDYGECDVPEPNEDFIALAAGDKHSLGLKADGSIVAWGAWHWGVPEPNAGFVAIAAAHAHSLGLKADGSIVAWGNNSGGQCDVPEPNADFRAIAAGSGSSIGIKSDGSIVVWGSNSHGQCEVPEPNTGFVAATADGGRILGVKADGSLVGWGECSDGKCDAPAPNTGFVAVAACDWYSLYLKSNGTIMLSGWGWHNGLYNYFGQCQAPEPNLDFVAVSAGGGHSLGLKDNGTIVAWGLNPYGECDVPSPNEDSVAVAAGIYHSLGLKRDGSIVAWGAGQPGQSGWPHLGQCDVPAPNTDFVAIAANWCHSLGVKSDGSIVGWGGNDYGQCDVPEPNEDFVAASAGVDYSLGLKSDGTVVAWGGSNILPDPNEGFVAIAAGDYHNLGLKASGSIVSWWWPEYVPEPNENFIGVAELWNHSLALKADGSVIAWGNNDAGQCNVPEPNAGFGAIAAGYTYSLGIKGDIPACFIRSSTPGDGWIDARQPVDSSQQNPAGWDSVEIAFFPGCDVSVLSADDFTISETCYDGECDGIAPEVESFVGAGSVGTLTLSRPVDPKTWTTITYHRGSAEDVIRLGYLPADADGSLASNANDIIEVVEGVQHGGPLHQFDIDRDGNLAADDITVLIDLLNGADPFESYWYKALPSLACGYGDGVEMGEVTNSGCLSLREGKDPMVLTGDEGLEAAGDDYPGCGEDEIIYTVEPCTLNVVHQNATYNCCLDGITITLDAPANRLSLTERVCVCKPMPVCNCCYNIETQITGIEPGTYTVVFCWEDWDTDEERCDRQQVVIP